MCVVVVCAHDSVLTWVQEGKKGDGGGGETKIESDKKRELLWKVDRHKRLPNWRWKSVNKVEELPGHDERSTHTLIIVC